jgi:hypothetical protein
MLKYLTKIAMDILPSVVATILGAYIVNHYIIAKPAAVAPTTAAVSSVDPKKPEASKSTATSADVGNIPQPGVTAKGISEKAMLEKTAAERPSVVEKSAERPAEKPADKPAETASIPVETRPHPRERVIARSVPAPVAPAAGTVAPVIAAPNTAPPVETAAPVEEHRDANELARAAIERLRGTGEASPRTQQAARTPDAVHIPDTPRVVLAPSIATAPPVRPLPPPIVVATPPVETTGSTPGPSRTAAIDRPTPPADIPVSSPSAGPGPLDLRAETVEPARREHTSVAQDMLLAAKSVFHAVLPKQLEPRSD